MVCPKQTFSEDGEVFCKTCPPGEYQPKPGSRSCLTCTSPLDDSACLKMLVRIQTIFVSKYNIVMKPAQGHTLV